MHTGILRVVDTHPLFGSTEHKAFVTDVLFPDSESTEVYWDQLELIQAQTVTCHSLVVF